MRRFFAAIAGLVAGYAAGAFLGYWAIMLLSTNTHDRALEASMTSGLILGPLGAIAGLVAGLVLTRRKAA
ncbi:MAG: hypothetical protein U1E28_09360 [Beijerinckiaceae bacterium]